MVVFWGIFREFACLSLRCLEMCPTLKQNMLFSPRVLTRQKLCGLRVMWYKFYLLLLCPSSGTDIVLTCIIWDSIVYGYRSWGNVENLCQIYFTRGWFTSSCSSNASFLELPEYSFSMSQLLPLRRLGGPGLMWSLPENAKILGNLFFPLFRWIVISLRFLWSCTARVKSSFVNHWLELAFFFAGSILYRHFCLT